MRGILVNCDLSYELGKKKEMVTITDCIVGEGFDIATNVATHWEEWLRDFDCTFFKNINVSEQYLSWGRAD